MKVSTSNTGTSLRSIFRISQAIVHYRKGSVSNGKDLKTHSYDWLANIIVKIGSDYLRKSELSSDQYTKTYNLKEKFSFSTACQWKTTCRKINRWKTRSFLHSFNPLTMNTIKYVPCLRKNSFYFPENVPHIFLSWQNVNHHTKVIFLFFFFFFKIFNLHHEKCQTSDANRIPSRYIETAQKLYSCFLIQKRWLFFFCKLNFHSTISRRIGL